MPCSTNSPIGALARIPRPARLVGLGLLTLLPSAAHAPSVAGNTPTALAPVTVWARGFLQPRGVVVNAQGAVFVADRLAGTVTRVAPDQSMTVVARGLERPVAVRFSPDGSALYVVDFGVMTMSARGPEPRKETGVLWRVTREAR